MWATFVEYSRHTSCLGLPILLSQRHARLIALVTVLTAPESSTTKSPEKPSQATAIVVADAAQKVLITNWTGEEGFVYNRRRLGRLWWSLRNCDDSMKWRDGRSWTRNEERPLSYLSLGSSQVAFSYLKSPGRGSTSPGFDLDDQL